jgi:hypothetical protein
MALQSGHNMVHGQPLVRGDFRLEKKSGGNQLAGVFFLMVMSNSV